MDKHTPIIIHGSDLYTRMLAHFLDEEMADTLGLECTTTQDGFAECPVPTGWWCVAWPNHVLTPRYNSDASYSRVSDTFAEVASDEFYREYELYDLAWRTVREAIDYDGVANIDRHHPTA